MKYSKQEILHGIPERDIEIALEVLRSVNYRSAYGHNPKCCRASGILIDLLDKNQSNQNLSLVDSKDAFMGPTKV